MIEQLKKIIMKRDILVSVCMSTYNHEEYIEEALNSVLEQECDFEYEIILSNDQSSDNTHAVITKYIENHPKGNKVRYYNQPKNLGINNNLIFTLEQTKGKYIALLEGDDYWTDSKKLQKQFDFLEKNTEYSICTAALKSIIPKEGLVLRTYEDHIEGVAYDLNDIRKIRPNYLNMFFRKDALDVNMLKNFKYSGDNAIFIMCLAEGKGYFMNQIMGFRRTHANGLWSSMSEKDRIKMGSDQYIGLLQYPKLRKYIRPILFVIYLDLFVIENESKYLKDALKLIKYPKEFFYFLKVVIFHSLNLQDSKRC